MTFNCKGHHICKYLMGLLVFCWWLFALPAWGETGGVFLSVQNLEESFGKGNAQAGYELGVRHFNGQDTDVDYGKALAFFKASAEKGHAESAYILAEIYQAGKGVPQNSHTAVEWYERAAQFGHVEAQYWLGVIYGEGVLKDSGVLQNTDLALYWFDAAARQGDPNAQYELGDLYYNGKFTKADPMASVSWFTHAARQGHPSAQYMLGVLFSEGKIVPQDGAISREWFSKAASGGHEKARGMLAKKGVLVEIPAASGSGKVTAGIDLKENLKYEGEDEFCKDPYSEDCLKYFITTNKAAHSGNKDGVRELYEISKRIPYDQLMIYLKEAETQAHQ